MEKGKKDYLKVRYLLNVIASLMILTQRLYFWAIDLVFFRVIFSLQGISDVNIAEERMRFAMRLKRKFP